MDIAELKQIAKRYIDGTLYSFIYPNDILLSLGENIYAYASDIYERHKDILFEANAYLLCGTIYIHEHPKKIILHWALGLMRKYEYEKRSS